MKIVVDRELCEANARCVGTAPEVFYVDENDTLHVLVETVDESLRDKVLVAVGKCPRGALSVTDE